MVLTDAQDATLDDLRLTHKSLVLSGANELTWVVFGAGPDIVKKLRKRLFFGRVKIVTH